MLLQIITPERVEWSGEIDKVILPSSIGRITILPGHVNMITGITDGEAQIFKQGKETSLFVSEGSAQIKNNEITLLVDIATEAKDLTAAQIEEAKKAALKARETTQDTLQFAEIESNLKRELAKEKILDKYRKKVKQVG